MIDLIVIACSAIVVVAFGTPIAYAIRNGLREMEEDERREEHRNG